MSYLSKHAFSIVSLYQWRSRGAEGAAATPGNVKKIKKLF